MSGAMSQRKGSGHELEVKKAFQSAGYSATKTGAYKDDDILVALGSYDLVIECKRRKRGFASLYKFLEQGDIVVHRDDHQHNLITMPLDLFFSLRGNQ